MGMKKHYPNPSNYRPWLGKRTNVALIQLSKELNLSVTDYLDNLIISEWMKNHPGEPYPELEQKE